MTVEEIKKEISFNEDEYSIIISDLKNELINKINTLDGFLPILQNLILEEEERKRIILEKEIERKKIEEIERRKIEEEKLKKQAELDEELAKVLKEAFSLI